MVRLVSMAMTGYYRTLSRPRAHQPLSMLKYDPIGTPLPTRREPALQTWRRKQTHFRIGGYIRTQNKLLPPGIGD